MEKNEITFRLQNTPPASQKAPIAGTLTLADDIFQTILIQRCHCWTRQWNVKGGQDVQNVLTEINLLR